MYIIKNDANEFVNVWKTILNPDKIELILDERQNNFIFILMNDETYEYIGKKVSVEDVTLFLEGKMDLKPIYENQTTNRPCSKV